MEGDGEVGEWGDGVVDWIGDEFSAGRDVGVSISGECERSIAGGIDGWRRGGERTRDVDRGDVESFGAKGVGEMNADGGATHGEMDDLAQGGVGEVFRRKRVVGFGNLLRCAPGGDPDR